MLHKHCQISAFFLVVLTLIAVGSAQQSPPAGSLWPLHTQTSDGAQVTIFQPQLDDFQGDTLTGRAAVAVTPAGQQQPVFGAVWLQSRVETDRVARTVRIVDVQVVKMRFPAADPVAQPFLTAAVQQAILAQPITLSLDHLLASLEALQKQQSAAADLQNAPPIILFRTHPAVKVQYDGAPQFVQATDSGLMRAVNTPFFVALDPPSRTYYLKGAGYWFSAPAPTGPFQYTTSTPPIVAAMATESGYVDPQQPIPNTLATSIEIVTATDPTELIWTDGPPQMTPIPGTQLLYWTNTDSCVFAQVGTLQMYLLLSGRWFTAPNQIGPWTFVAPGQLPPDFARIPPTDPKLASVLADVPGTQQAQDAVADSFIPQTAAVDLHNFDQPPVTYDGNPDFEPIPGTDLSYAVNTDASVLLLNGTYYCCYNAVWYNSASPLGPWAICQHVPADIYTIPPSCPIYPVRYCYVYGYTPDVVYCGYLPGYVGCYDYDGTVVYGTGYHYKPWFHDRYIPRPYTFGFSARYHAYSGHWGFSIGTALGGGGVWIGNKDRYAGPGGAWFGYGGYRPSMVRGAKINQAIVDASKANIQADRDRDPYGRNVYQRRSDLHGELPAVTPRSPAIAANPPEQLRDNNVYADPTGNVYRRTDTGWETRQGNGWVPTLPESHPQPQPPKREDLHQTAQPPHVEEPVRQPAENPAPGTEQRQEPAAPEQPREQRHQEPAASPPPDVNRDYNARVEGQQRAQEQPREEPQPRQEPQPAPEPQRGGGGGGGGRR